MDRWLGTGYNVLNSTNNVHKLPDHGDHPAKGSCSQPLTAPNVVRFDLIYNQETAKTHTTVSDSKNAKNIPTNRKPDRMDLGYAPRP